MVTAELAVALPALVVVLLAALTAVAAVTAQLRCADAAATGARLAARGEAQAVVDSTARRAAPPGASVSTVGTATTVTVTVRAQVRPLGSRLLPAVSVTAREVQEREATEPEQP